MADEASFDVVSKPDMAEVKNALQQVEREIENRYDFKDSISEVKLEGEKLVLKSDDEYRLASLVDVLQSKLIKRGVDIKFLEYGKIEAASKMTVRQEVTIKTGIPTDKAKQIVKLIKDKGWKVTTQIQDQQIRVVSKSKDDLQQVIAFLKTDPVEDVPLQFTNYR
jgi:cyclic-di-GMP-binding protein